MTIKTISLAQLLTVTGGALPPSSPVRAQSRCLAHGGVQGLSSAARPACTCGHR